MVPAVSEDVVIPAGMIRIYHVFRWVVIPAIIAIAFLAVQAHAAWDQLQLVASLDQRVRNIERMLFVQCVRAAANPNQLKECRLEE